MESENERDRLQKDINQINAYARGKNFGIPKYTIITDPKLVQNINGISWVALRDLSTGNWEYDQTDYQDAVYYFNYPKVALTDYQGQGPRIDLVLDTIIQYDTQTATQTTTQRDDKCKQNYEYWKEKFRAAFQQQIIGCTNNIRKCCADIKINPLQFAFQKNINLYNCITCHYNSFIQLFTQSNKKLRDQFFEFLGYCAAHKNQPNTVLGSYIQFWGFTETYLLAQYICIQIKQYIQHNCVLLLPYVAYQNDWDNQCARLSQLIKQGMEDHDLAPVHNYLNQLGCLQMDKCIKQFICFEMTATKNSIQPALGQSHVDNIRQNILDPLNQQQVDNTNQHTGYLDHALIITNLMRMLHVTLDQINKIPLLRQAALLIPQTQHTFFTRVASTRQTLAMQFSIPLFVLEKNITDINVYKYITTQLQYGPQVGQEQNVLIQLSPLIFVQRKEMVDGKIGDIVDDIFYQKRSVSPYSPPINLFVKETNRDSPKRYQIAGIIQSDDQHTLCYIRNKIEGTTDVHYNFNDFLKFDDNSTIYNKNIRIHAHRTFPQIMHGLILEKDDPFTLELYQQQK